MNGIGIPLWQRMSLALALCVIAIGVAHPAAREVRGFTLTVSNLDRSVEFYELALGFHKVGERTVVDPRLDELNGIFGTRIRAARMQLGSEFIELEQFVAGAGQPAPPDSRSNDLWFQHFAIVVSDMDRAWEHLRGFPIQAISNAPQTIPATNVAAAGIRAVKFRDPDGHPLELLWFPADKGKPVWHAADGRLFLGIDHSAIAVSDTERSHAFWRDLLGLKVAGGSVNAGSTQEQLDNAFGAVVRITGMVPAQGVGPGIEYLQYLTPSGGRATPGTLRPNDLVATRTVVAVDDLDALALELQAGGVAFISPRIVPLDGGTWRRGLMVKDPDGHPVLLVE